MSARRIRPGDVQALDAGRILAALNAAQTPEELAAAIEIPGELDIGLRLGERLLARRAQLGRFTSLEQVDEVPLIGPVRFTQIVRALTGAVHPEEQVSAALLAAVLGEVSSLRALVGELGRGIRPDRVTLRAVEPVRYLGEPARLEARVVAPDGTARADAAVTLATSWGRLRAADGYSVEEGTAITVRTALDGTVRARLLPPTSEALHGAPQAALEDALRRLLPDVETPQAAAAALRELVREYRRDANADLRRAIDVYFRDFHGHLLDRVTARNELLEWSHVDAALVAHLQTETAVDATATLVVRFRSWLGPWLQAYGEVARGESTLGLDLALATNDENARAIADRVHRQVGRFVEVQRGVVGQAVAQRLVERELDTFLTETVERVPVERRPKVFHAVESAATTMASAGAGALQALTRTRVELREEVTSQVHETVDSALVDSAAFAALRSDVQTALAAKLDQSALDAALADVVTQSALDAALTDVVTKPALDAALDAALAAKVDQQTFDAALATKVDTAALNAKLASASTLGDLRTGLPLRPGG